MRSGCMLIGIVVAVLSSGCRPTQESQSMQATELPVKKLGTEIRTVQAGCATCIFDMQGVSGCKLAVKIDGKPYLVTGSDIDDHGDAHASDGMCLVARPAEVSGVIEGDRFVATEFRLKP